MLRCLCYKKRSGCEVRQHQTARVGIVGHHLTHTGLARHYSHSLALFYNCFNDCLFLCIIVQGVYMFYFGLCIWII